MGKEKFIPDWGEVDGTIKTIGGKPPHNRNRKRIHYTIEITPNNEHLYIHPQKLNFNL